MTWHVPPFDRPRSGSREPAPRRGRPQHHRLRVLEAAEVPAAPQDAVTALAAIDPEAAALVRRWATSGGMDAFTVVETLARHVLGVDTLFEWASAREPTSSVSG